MTSAEQKIVLGYPEAARLLDVSERTLERWVRERRIPFVRLPQRGRRCGVRFVAAQLLRWLDQQTVRPVRGRRNEAEVVIGDEDF